MNRHLQIKAFRENRFRNMSNSMSHLWNSLVDNLSSRESNFNKSHLSNIIKSHSKLHLLRLLRRNSLRRTMLISIYKVGKTKSRNEKNAKREIKKIGSGKSEMS